ARQQTRGKYAHPQNDDHQYFSHLSLSSECSRRRSALVAHCLLLRGENWITLHINPICSSRRNVAAQAIFLVVGCNLLVGSGGVVESPAPAIAPQWIARIAAFLVLNHHEPDLGSRSPVGVAGCHLCVIGSEHFFHEDRSICELSRLAIVLGCAKGCVSDMHLVSLRIENHVRSDRLISIPVVWWLPNVPDLVHQVKTYVSAVVLRSNLVAKHEEREDEQRAKDIALCWPNALPPLTCAGASVVFADILKLWFGVHFSSACCKRSASPKSARFLGETPRNSHDGLHA